VLDEADKLFELGFMEQVDGIIAACNHKDVTRALFSATLPEKVEELARYIHRSGHSLQSVFIVNRSGQCLFFSLC